MVSLLCDVKSNIEQHRTLSVITLISVMTLFVSVMTLFINTLRDDTVDKRNSTMSKATWNDVVITQSVAHMQ